MNCVIINIRSKKLTSLVIPFQVLLIPSLLSNDTDPGTINITLKWLKAEIECMFSSIHKLIRSSPLRKLWTKHNILAVHQEKPPGGTQPLSQLKIKQFTIQQRGNNFIAVYTVFQELLKRGCLFNSHSEQKEHTPSGLQPSPVLCTCRPRGNGTLIWKRKDNTWIGV